METNRYRRKLIEVIEKLPPDDQHILQMCLIEGCIPAEVAAILGISPIEAEVSYLSALCLLRAELGPPPITRR